MKSNIITKEAYKAFKKGSTSVVIQLLEKNITISNDPYDFFLLVIAYLLKDKLVQAEATLRKALRQHQNYIPLLEIKAFLILKAAKTKDDACSGYVDIIKLSPNNKKITKIIKIVHATDDFEKFQKKARIKDFITIQPPKKHAMHKHYPPKRAKFPVMKCALLFSIIAIIIAGIIFFSSPLAKLITQKISLLFTETRSDIHELSNITLDGMHYDVIDTIQKFKTPEFYTSGEECIRDFNHAKWLIKEGKENEAMIILNKIDASNVQMKVKQRVAFLKDFIIRNRERTVAGYLYNDVIKKPYLYKGVNVKWRGKIANYKKQDGNHTFQLLINFANDRFDGVVEVFSSIADNNITNGTIANVEGIITNIVAQKIIVLQALNIEIVH